MKWENIAILIIILLCFSIYNSTLSNRDKMEFDFKYKMSLTPLERCYDSCSYFSVKNKLLCKHDCKETFGECDVK